MEPSQIRLVCCLFKVKHSVLNSMTKHNQFIFFSCYQSVTNWFGSRGSPGSRCADAIMSVTLICLYSKYYKVSQVNLPTEEFLQLIPFNSFTKVWGKFNNVWLNLVGSSGTLPLKIPFSENNEKQNKNCLTLIVFFWAGGVKCFKLVRLWETSSLAARTESINSAYLKPFLPTGKKQKRKSRLCSCSRAGLAINWVIQNKTFDFTEAHTVWMMQSIFY